MKAFLVSFKSSLHWHLKEKFRLIKNYIKELKMLTHSGKPP